MKEEKITKRFTVELNKEDYELLKKWNYDFEKDIEKQIKEVAMTMKFYIQEAKAT